MTEHLSEERIQDQPAGITPEVAEQQLNDRVGLAFTELTSERVTATLPVEGNLQPYGLLHGGANAVLAEAIGSTVANLNVDSDHVVMGLELSCTHHRPVRSGHVTGVATPAHVGRGTITADIVITDESGKRSCTARLTCVVRPRPAGT